jgi:hypothetical protein
MSLSHPVVPINNSVNLPTGFGNINSALQTLDTNHVTAPADMRRFAAARLGIVNLTSLVNDRWNALPFVTNPTGCFDQIGLTFVGRLFRFPAWVRYAAMHVHIFTDISTAQYCHLAVGRAFWNVATHGVNPPDSANSQFGYSVHFISGCLRGNYANFADQETGGRIYAVDPASDSTTDGNGNRHAHGAMAYIAGGARNLRNNGEVRLSVYAWGVK